MQKRIFILLTGALLCMTCAAEELESYFHIRIKSGNWKVIEDLYIKQFKDDFFFKADKKTFSVKTTLDKRSQFIGSLKKLGHHIENTSDPDVFTLVVLEREGAMILYTIDSSAVNTTPQRLVELQNLLGKSIRGSKTDMIRRRETELPGIRLALERSGFECEIKGSTIIIRERKYPREFLFPEGVRKQVTGVFGQLQIPCEIKGNRISCRITNSQLQKLQHDLLSSGSIYKITIEKDGIFKLLPVPTAKYRVTISFNNRFEYEKCVRMISSSRNFTIADEEFEEHAAGINLCTLTLRSRKATASEIKSEIWRQIRKAGTRLRERDIKINKL